MEIVAVNYRKLILTTIPSCQRSSMPSPQNLDPEHHESHWYAAVLCTLSERAGFSRALG